eukprot:TRINITY_DN4409_c0_g2_i2.p1 TRINITY_DN4409_c0_g2~~TRINITY_DN4409_c0_g2_i2.p1  ORF type:complete len:547 (-),score=167.06 TRINITY_DN4409_c0_g2_i2:63-1703(-)
MAMAAFGALPSDALVPGALAEAFLAFAGGAAMDGRSFVKCLKDAGLLDEQFSTNDADLIFTRCRVLRAKQLERRESKRSSDGSAATTGTFKQNASRLLKERRLDVVGFQTALGMVGQQKGLEPHTVENMVADLKGPVYNTRTSSPLRVTHQDSQSRAGPERFFYDKSTYTGTHRHGGPSSTGNGTVGKGGYSDLSKLVDRDHIQDDWLQRRKSLDRQTVTALLSDASLQEAHPDGTVRPKQPAIVELEECPPDLPWMTRLYHEKTPEGSAAVGLAAEAEGEAADSSHVDAAAQKHQGDLLDLVEEHEEDASPERRPPAAAATKQEAAALGVAERRRQAVQEMVVQKLAQQAAQAAQASAQLLQAAAEVRAASKSSVAADARAASKSSAAAAPAADVRAASKMSAAPVPAVAQRPPSPQRQSSQPVPVTTAFLQQQQQQQLIVTSPLPPGVRSIRPPMTTVPVPDLAASFSRPVAATPPVYQQAATAAPPLVVQRAPMPVLLGSFQTRPEGTDAYAWTGPYKHPQVFATKLHQPASAQVVAPSYVQS